MTQRTSRRLPKRALLAGTATLAFAAVALAQSGTLSIPPELRTAGQDPAATGTPQSGATPGRPGSQAGATRRVRTPTARRTHPPAKAIVQVPTQIPTISPAVAPDVQLPVVGLPDPLRPLALPRLRRPAADDPYAPLGIRTGGLLFYPSIQQDLGYDTNPNRESANVKGSWVSRTEGALRVQSDWIVHELTADLRGAYTVYPDVTGADRPDGAGRVGLRLDASRDTSINLEGRYLIDTQRPGSPELNATVRDRPVWGTYGASAGVTQRFNRLELGLKGTIDHTFYEDARLTNGTILSQHDRELTQYGIQARAAYELTPGVKPFVEGLVDTRVYDQTIDTAGFRRSSDGIGARAGSTFELTRLLTGELSAGYQRRHYDDPRLRDLAGPIFDASLAWSVTPLTTVRVRGQTTLDESTIPNASGAVTNRVALEVQHDLRRNLTLIGAITAGQTNYRGISLREDAIAASLKLDYRLTRWLALRASVTHERLNSTAPGADYKATTYLVGLRLQP
jgi:hypothetical protein